MVDLAERSTSLDGEVLTSGSSAYEAVRSEVDPAQRDVRPRLIVRCCSMSDVVQAIDGATSNGDRVAVRGGGHCFAGRSWTDGMVLDMSGLAGVSVDDDGLATIGAGARLGHVYAALHARGRTLPAGCGDTVGIAGLTLGGGIGLLGRLHGLTCDRLLGARVVLADGRVVECDAEHEPDLFWALRGAGGGQFGVVTELRFDTLREPATTRIEARSAVPLSASALEDLIGIWQDWAPAAPDALTANLSVVAGPGGTVQAVLFGASMLEEGATRQLLDPFFEQVRPLPTPALQAGMPYSELKGSLADPADPLRHAIRSRSEFFARSMSADTVASLVDHFLESPAGCRRRLAFTAMGGAYDRVAADATAFAHRDVQFLLEHVSGPGDPWVDESWETAHVDGSGRVYPNFPDPALDDWVAAYHAGNHPRLVSIKHAYDPHRVFDFPQAI